MKFLSTLMMVFSFSIAAKAEPDIYDCAGTAVKAAMINAKEYMNGSKVTYGDIYQIRPSEHRELTVYEISLLKWSDSDSFGLDYEVVVKGHKPNCKVVRVEIIGEE